MLIVSSFCISSAYCDPNNGRFEVYDYNEILDINHPADWYHDANYTEIVRFLSPRSPQWKLKTDLQPFDGDYFLLLSTGAEDIRGLGEHRGSKVWQTINVEAGDKLTGVYFFGTLDWNPYPDWGKITLIPLETGEPMELVYVDVLDVGSYNSSETGSMSGWKRFEYTFEITGTYELIVSVADFDDAAYDSFFAVDGLIICHNPPLKNDLNCDCTVNFDDFALLANDWMCNCKDPVIHNDPQSDPNLYNDPNSNCLLGTDINEDGPVDFADVNSLAEYWLEGIEE
ncbi:MAG: hypothetical protein A2Y10_10880 [Planctomycetes bacterium GWF2_41_51]|nr:MAG: hypothetical protein A2Y10_10880 [Planctomycetes bacterium GWF2_41_51]HBG28449.1 hypothetical protein [Phycisphaerales bacterium]